MKSIKLWAIVDTSKPKERFCYADAKKTKGAMAIYNKKPVIADKWKPFKKVVRVLVTTDLDNECLDCKEHRLLAKEALKF